MNMKALDEIEMAKVVGGEYDLPCLSDPFGPSEPISPAAPAEPEPETAAPTGHQVSFGDELNTLINLHNSRR